MIVYSKKIVRFIEEVESLAAAVIRYEARLKVTQSRFYDRAEYYSYPIKIVVFNDRSELGYFDPNFFEMGFHERALYLPREKLLNLIRHEVAHYLLYIESEEQNCGHGAEYRKLCESFGWGEEVYRSEMILDEEGETLAAEESAVLRRVKKLMALASSSNANEAEQAMIKSQQLLLQHNLESRHLEEESRYELRRILPYRRRSEKISAIGTILQTFFVHVVFKKGREESFVEIMGDRDNLEIAEYVASFLYAEFDRLWVMVQQEIGLKGTTSKNSFFRGLARGYLEKVGALKMRYSTDVKSALLVIENRLEKASSLAYKRLSSYKSNAKECLHSGELGRALGQKMNIRPGIQRGENSGKALTYSER